MSVAGYTPLIEAAFPASINLNLATEITIYLKIDSEVILKFHHGGGAGYDGDITINPTESRKCTCVATPSQASRIVAGTMKAEFKLAIPFTGYPAGRIIRGSAVLQKITEPNTIP